MEKQNFIYSVFEDKIQTSMGRHLVRKYERTYDAQSVYVELVLYSKESTQASIEAANILSYLSTVKLHKIIWKGTYHDFILHWVNKLRLYEEMVPLQDHLTNNVKKTLLENTVMGVPILCNVKSQADHDKAHGKVALSYDNYLTILLSAASTHDADNGFKQRRNLSAYSSLQYYTTPNDTSNLQYDIELHDIDTECLTHYDQEIFQTYQHTSSDNIKIPKDKWLSLSRQEKLAWNTLSNKTKAMILGTSSPIYNSTNETTHHDNIPRIQANSTHINQPYETSDDNISPQQSEDTNNTTGSNNDNIITFLTDQGHPGDLRNVLSSSNINKIKNKTKTNKELD